VLGSVCSLISYTRSWVSDRDDAAELGRAQLGLWSEAIRRAMAFRDRVGEERFADVRFDDLQTDPVGAVAAAYERLGLEFGEGRAGVEEWAGGHRPRSLGVHAFDLGEFGLDAGTVRREFSPYLDRFAPSF